MAKMTAENTREKLIQAGTDLVRRCGYVATTVDEICQQAGVTKGAFFHHFQSKEALAEACLEEWERQVNAMYEQAPFQAIEDPYAKLLGSMDFFIGVFGNPKMTKSCLAGTTVQEVSETHPRLREAAQACFASGERNFQAVLSDACRSKGVKLDTGALARLWMATIQGSLLLAKASRDGSVVAENLKQFKEYVEMLLTKQSKAK
jgi:TetR/AcrR family transcriptional repressor of nem operon